MHRGYRMANRMLAHASTLLSAGAEAGARNGLRFVFTCESFSDGTPTTVYVNVRITNSDEVSVCGFEVRRGQVPGTDQKGPMPFPDSDSMDESSFEDYCGADFVSRTQ
jgi:hypothetical protein